MSDVAHGPLNGTCGSTEKAICGNCVCILSIWMLKMPEPGVVEQTKRLMISAHRDKHRLLHVTKHPVPDYRQTINQRDQSSQLTIWRPLLKRLKTTNGETIRVSIPNQNQSPNKIRAPMKKLQLYVQKIHSLGGSWICLKPQLPGWTDE